MNSVVKAIREKYPDAYGDLSDEQLTVAVAETYPVYLERPDFKADYDKTKPGLKAQQKALEPSTRQADLAEKAIDAASNFVYGMRPDVVVSNLTRPIGQALNTAGRYAGGLAADVLEELPKGQIAPRELDNTMAAIKGQPLPATENQTLTQQAITEGAAALPTIAGAMGLAAVGAPAPLAFAGTMGASALEASGGDPLQASKAATIGAILPGVGNLGRKMAGKLLQRSVEKGFIGAESTVAQKAIESLTSQAMIQGAIEVFNAPEYAGMSTEQAKEALFKSVVGNLAFGIMEIPGWRGGNPSETQRLIAQDLLSVMQDGGEATNKESLTVEAEAGLEVEKTPISVPKQEVAAATSLPQGDALGGESGVAGGSQVEILNDTKLAPQYDLSKLTGSQRESLLNIPAFRPPPLTDAVMHPSLARLPDHIKPIGQINGLPIYQGKEARKLLFGLFGPSNGLPAFDEQPVFKAKGGVFVDDYANGAKVAYHIEDPDGFYVVQKKPEAVRGEKDIYLLFPGHRAVGPFATAQEALKQASKDSTLGPPEVIEVQGGKPFAKVISPKESAKVEKPGEIPDAWQVRAYDEVLAAADKSDLLTSLSPAQRDEATTFILDGLMARAREYFDKHGSMDGFATQKVIDQQAVSFQRKVNAQKRGGGKRDVSLDEPLADTDEATLNENIADEGAATGRKQAQLDEVKSVYETFTEGLSEPEQAILEGVRNGEDIRDVAKALKIKPKEAEAIRDKLLGQLKEKLTGQGIDSPDVLATIHRATLPRRISSSVKPSFAGGQPVTLEGIRKYLSEALDIPIRAGVNVPGGIRRAMGLFRPQAETIRTRLLNDIPTIAHEVGHYLHFVLFPGTRGTITASDFGARFDHELMKLGQRTSGPNYGPHQVRLEGVAEYLREWLTDRAAARAAAPDFTLFMEGELQTNHKPIWDILEKAHSDIQKYISLDPQTKIHTHISVGEDQPRLPLREWLSRQYTRWVNGLNPIEKAGKRLEELGLPRHLARLTGELAVNYKGGWAGKVEHSLFQRQIDYNGNDVGPSLKELLLGVNRDNLRDYLVSARALELNRRGLVSGVDPDEARLVVHRLMREYEPIRKKLLHYQENTLRLLLDAGILSKSQFAKMKAKNRYYVPFYRVYEAVSGDASKGAGKGMVDLGTGVHKFKGSDRRIIDPLESIIKNSYVFRDLAERNRIARSFAASVEAVRGGGRVAESVAKPVKTTRITDAEVKAALELRGFDTEGMPDLTFTIYRAMDASSSKRGIFTVWEKGKQKAYQVDDPELYRALTGADAETAGVLHSITKPLRVLASGLRAGATLTVEFAVRNPLRDQYSATINSKYGFVPLWDGAVGLFHAVGRTDLYWEWVKSGGRYADMVAVDRNSTQEALRALVKDQTALSMALEWVNPLNVIKNLRRISETMEAATRISEFRRAKLAGASDLEAANASKEVTLNFSRHGTYGKAVNQLIAFFNAHIQDIDKTIRAHKERPFPTITKNALMLSVPSTLLWWANRDDKAIEDLPDWRKNMFWNINTGRILRAAGATEAEDFILSMPKPFLYGQLYANSVERALDFIYKKDQKALMKWAGDTLGVTHITLEDVIPKALPTGIKPAVELAFNYNTFTQQPIESQGLQRLPPSDRALPSTSQFAVGSSKALERIGVDMSPVKIDHLVRGYLAGLGKYGTDATDYALARSGLADLPPAPAKSLAEAPGVRAFTVSPYSPNAYVDRFYKGYELAEQRINAFRLKAPNLQSGDERRFWDKNGRETLFYMRGGMAKARWVREQLTLVSAAMKKVQTSKDLDPETKRDRLIKLSKTRNTLAELGFRQLHPTDQASAK